MAKKKIKKPVSPHRRIIQIEMFLPVSVVMMVEPEDPEDLENTTWSAVEIREFCASDVSVSDVHEQADQDTSEYIDEQARNADDVED